MVRIPRKDCSGQNILKCVSTKLGIPTKILKVYRGSHLISGQKTYAIPSGTFLRVTLGLPGGKRDHQLLYHPSTTDPYWNPTNPAPWPPAKDSTWARGGSSTARDPNRRPHTLKGIAPQTPPPQGRHGINAVPHLWSPSKKDTNRRAHTINGNPGMSRPQPAQQDQVTLEANQPTHLAEDISTLWDKWKSMLKLARQANIFNLPVSIADAAKNCLPV